jgi:hypothetical protein
MPWQLSGNGRNGWSTKLIRGLKAEAAAGFQSRRERCREPTPVTPQYAAFPTYKAARVRYACLRGRSRIAARGARATADDASDRLSRSSGERWCAPSISNECPLLAQSGHADCAAECPLLGVKRTSTGANPMSAFDPKRTLNAPNGPAVEAGFSHYQNAPLSRYDAAS